MYCKGVEKSRATVALRKVNTIYWKAKQAEIDKEEERKRKREATRDNREKGWQVAHTDEWSDEEEVTEQQNRDDTGQEGVDEDEESDDDQQSMHQNVNNIREDYMLQK